MRARTKSRWRIQGKRIARLVVAAFLWAIPGSGLAQKDVIIADGQLTFWLNCAGCHGIDAKGEGPLAKWFNVEPTDLTQLSKKYGGTFPFWYTYQVIDGRDIIVRGHGTSEMPIWGREFLMEAGRGYGAEAVVRGKILGLVYYLQSLQEQ